jgi:hypothetical protein
MKALHRVAAIRARVTIDSTGPQKLISLAFGFSADGTGAQTSTLLRIMHYRAAYDRCSIISAPRGSADTPEIRRVTQADA